VSALITGCAIGPQICRLAVERESNNWHENGIFPRNAAAAWGKFSGYVILGGEYWGNLCTTCSKTEVGVIF